MVEHYFSSVFNLANNQVLQARDILVVIFQTLLSFTYFSHELLVHINENVSFQHVAFLHLIRYGNLHHKCLN